MRPSWFLGAGLAALGCTTLAGLDDDYVRKATVQAGGTSGTGDASDEDAALGASGSTGSLGAAGTAGEGGTLGLGGDGGTLGLDGSGGSEISDGTSDGACPT